MKKQIACYASISLKGQTYLAIVKNIWTQSRFNLTPAQERHLASKRRLLSLQRLLRRSLESNAAFRRNSQLSVTWNSLHDESQRLGAPL